MSDIQHGNLCYICAETVHQQNSVRCGQCTFIVHTTCLAQKQKKRASGVKIHDYICKDCKKSRNTNFSNIESILSHRYEKNTNMIWSNVSYQVEWSSGEPPSIVQRKDLGYCQDVLADYWKKVDYKGRMR